MNETLPRRDAVLALLASRGRPLTMREMAARLLVSEGAYPGFVRYIESLAQEGELRSVEHERYALDEPAGPRSARERRAPDEVEGRLLVDARGGCQVVNDEGEALLIPDHATSGALHGDRVLARAVRKGAQGPEGEVIRVLERAQHRVAGTLRRRGASSWLEPDDTRVRGRIVLRGEGPGRDGDAAVARITRFPELPDENPEGELVAALGPAGTLRAEEAKILTREGVDELPPDAAEQEARRWGGQVPAAALVGREDLQKIPLPTIDPEDARDHDDAVWVERAADGSYTAWVAVADVSHYVTPGSALDEAARDRGCSIYLPDRALPMLPPSLSAGLCSLLPGELRLCLCAIIRLGPGGELLDASVVRGVMRSVARLTYRGVAQALGWSEGAASVDESLLAGLRVADQLAQILRTRREQRGALDFQIPEARVRLRDGAPRAIERRAEDPGERRAYQLVEELMLLANEVAARFLIDRGLTAIFRVHGPPDERKLERFLARCDEVGLPLEPDDAADPLKLAQHLRKLATHPQATILNTLLLRAMRQASYDVTSTGHFGLASPAYAHFTSPIRRYPDLTVHRVIKAALDAGPSGRGLAQTADEEQRLAADATRSSERERRALRVERDVLDLYRAFFMRDHLGESYEGVVSAVTSAGAYVTLDDPFVDVLVRVEALGRDLYELDDERMRFFGRRTGDSVGLGDRLTVTIDEVVLLRREIHAFRHVTDAVDRAPLRHAPLRPTPKKRATPARRRR